MPMDLTPVQRAALLDAARGVIRARVAGFPKLLPRGDEPAPVKSIPEDDDCLINLAGCFVSLHTMGPPRRLRGCIGRLEANKPVWDAVHDAAAAVLEDPRFVDQPVLREDLAGLDIEITVISPLRPAGGVLDFEPLLDGIVLSIGERSGCFLPQVARETGWTREQLLDRLCSEKLGLAPARWRSSSDAKLQRFTTIIIGPEPFERAVGADRGNETSG
jgi:AmmeMemoRadiSam system protein A